MVNVTSKVFDVSAFCNVTGHTAVVQFVPASKEYCTSEPTSCFTSTDPEASIVVTLLVKVSKEYPSLVFVLVANTFTSYIPFCRELKSMMPVSTSMVIPDEYNEGFKPFTETMLKEQSVTTLIPEFDASVALDGLYNVLVNADKRYGTLGEFKSISVHAFEAMNNDASALVSDQFVDPSVK